MSGRPLKHTKHILSLKTYRQIYSAIKNPFLLPKIFFNSPEFRTVNAVLYFFYVRYVISRWMGNALGPEPLAENWWSSLFIFCLITSRVRMAVPIEWDDISIVGIKGISFLVCTSISPTCWGFHRIFCTIHAMSHGTTSIQQALVRFDQQRKILNLPNSGEGCCCRASYIRILIRLLHWM